MYRLILGNSTVGFPVIGGVPNNRKNLLKGPVICIISKSLLQCSFDIEELAISQKSESAPTIECKLYYLKEQHEPARRHGCDFPVAES